MHLQVLKRNAFSLKSEFEYGMLARFTTNTCTWNWEQLPNGNSHLPISKQRSGGFGFALAILALYP